MANVKQRGRIPNVRTRLSQENFENESDIKIRKALSWKMSFPEKPQIYHMTISMAFDFLRIIGRAPFYRDSRGRIEYKFVSGIMLYSVIVYILVGISSVYSIIDITSRPKSTFNGQLDNILTSFMIAPQLITPILSWIQMRSHQNYLDRWIIFQEKYEKITEDRFPRVKISFLRLLSFAFIFVFMSFLIIPHYLINDLRWYHFPGYIFNILGTLLHFVYWKLTSKMISEVSNQFHAHFYEEVKRSKNYTVKIEDYRLLWMMLSQLIKKCGSSSSGVISMFILTNMIYLVCIIYNTGFDSLENYKLLNFYSIFVAILVTIFWWIILMAYCEAGYKMTESSMRSILHSVLEIKTNNVLSHEDELHVNIFLYTLKQYSSEATVSDYFVINRSLFGSIITALVTYVIVMIQFHVNNISSDDERNDKLYDYSAD